MNPRACIWVYLYSKQLRITEAHASELASLKEAHAKAFEEAAGSSSTEEASAETDAKIAALTAAHDEAMAALKAEFEFKLEAEVTMAKDDAAAWPERPYKVQQGSARSR